MSEQRAMLCDTAEALFATVDGPDFLRSWSIIEEAGFASLLVAEEQGGFGGDAGDLFAVARLAGFHALPLPLGETIIAAKLLADTAIAFPAGACGLGSRVTGRIAGGRYSGTLHRVGWGRHLDHVAALLEGTIVVLPVSGATIDEGESPAGEPQDTLTFINIAVQSASSCADIMQWGALLRTAQIAGALDRALNLSVDHVNQRQQFGKPLAKFQAVQQSLALLAIEAAAANIAGAAAAEALDTHREAGFEAGAAKLRANRAAANGIAIAHQVHGAVGFTKEYALHRVTRRMMGWRSEFGNDAYWTERLGTAAMAGGGVGLWSMMTARSDKG